MDWRPGMPYRRRLVRRPIKTALDEPHNDTTATDITQSLARSSHVKIQRTLRYAGTLLGEVYRELLHRKWQLTAVRINALDSNVVIKGSATGILKGRKIGKGKIASAITAKFGP